MCFLFSLLPATFWVVIGYFVLFSSAKAGDGIRTFGRVLAIWIFVIAGVFSGGWCLRHTRWCLSGHLQIAFGHDV